MVPWESQDHTLSTRGLEDPGEKTRIASAYTNIILYLARNIQQQNGFLSDSPHAIYIKQQSFWNLPTMQSE